MELSTMRVVLPFIQNGKLCIVCLCFCAVDFFKKMV